MSKIPTPQFYSPKQVRSLTSLSEPTLWRMRRQGTFPQAVKLSDRRVGYPAEVVDNWIRERAAA